LLEERGIVKASLRETGARLLLAVTYEDFLTVRTFIENWGAKMLRHRYLVYRGDQLMCDGFEVRVFVARDL